MRYRGTLTALARRITLLEARALATSRRRQLYVVYEDDALPAEARPADVVIRVVYEDEAREQMRPGERR